jgi:protein O-GlcNAc transferase
MALVTIGIPVYNEEKYLEQTIGSAINQDFKDIEIVISDNGSTDGSVEIIKKYADLDKRIYPIYKEKNTGPAGNFHSLLDNTRSKYFVLLGAHDLFLPN